MKNEIFEAFLETTKSSPEQLEVNSAYMFVSRSLERIAEHALNIAEDVIYMIKGEIVRHQEQNRTTQLSYVKARLNRVFTAL